MPGFTDRDRYFMGVMNDSRTTPEQRAAAMYVWENENSGWNQPRSNGVANGFTGSASGEVMPAPWRGEFDMPGNFERKQSMANSLAEDALLRRGLQSKYEFDPKKPITGDIYTSPVAMYANAPELAKKEQAYFMGPPNPSDYGMPGDTRRFNRGNMLTADEVEWIKKMMANGMGDMVARQYGDNPVFQYLMSGGQ